MKTKNYKILIVLILLTTALMYFWAYRNNHIVVLRGDVDNYLSPGAPIYGPQVVPNATDVQTGEPIYINPDGNVYRVR